MKFPTPPESAESQNAFLKLKDGESIYILCRGYVQEYYQIWRDKKPVVVDKDEEGARWRCRVNVITANEDQTTYQARMLDYGPQIGKQLQEIQIDFDVENTFLRLKRVGTELDTQYTLMPSPKLKIDDKVEGIIETLPMHDLEKIMDDQKKSQVFNPPPAGLDKNEEIPF